MQLGSLSDYKNIETDVLFLLSDWFRINLQRSKIKNVLSLGAKEPVAAAYR